MEPVSLYVDLTERIIGAGIEAHRHLGPGLLESTYEECLSYELQQQGLVFDRQISLPVHYKGVKLASVYRPDFIVESQVIVEVKSLDAIAGVHQAQVRTYLKLTGLKVGLLLNFNTEVLREGIRRISV